MKKLELRHVGFLWSELKALVGSPPFILLTLLGNGLICLSAILFYLIEEGTNPKVRRFMDALWWAFAPATTTGYGDITPATDAGKVLSILLMLLGLAIFAMYTALFAETILASKNTGDEGA